MPTVSPRDGIIVALLHRFERVRLPRTLNIKTRVEAGARLSDADLTYLREVMEDAMNFNRFVAQRPDLQEFYRRVIRLYQGIVARALANERAASNQAM